MRVQISKGRLWYGSVAILIGSAIIWHNVSDNKRLFKVLVGEKNLSIFEKASKKQDEGKTEVRSSSPATSPAAKSPKKGEINEDEDVQCK
jgi:hypothetical protein